MSDRNVNINVNGKDNASRALTKVGKSTDMLAGQLGGLKSIIGGLATGIALRAAVGKFNSIAESMDEVGKASDRLGIATEKLGGLKWAAEQSGVEFEALDDAIVKMNRNLSEVASGDGAKAAGALNEIGLNIKEIRALSPDRQFGKIADALNKVSNAQDKIRLVQAIFGRSGADLINLLNEGSAGFAKFTKEAEGMGLLFNREEAAKLERYNDAVGKLGKSYDALWQTIAIGASPGITSALDFVNDHNSGGNKQYWDTFWSALNQAGPANVMSLLGNVEDTPEVAKHLRVGAATAEERAANLAKNRALNPGSTAFMSEPEARRKELRRSFFGGIGKSSDDLFGKSSVGSIFDRLGGMAGKAKETGMEVGRNLVTGIKTELDRQKDVKDRIAELTEGLRTPIEVYRDGLNEIKALEGQGLDSETAGRQRKSLLEDFGLSLPSRGAPTQLEGREFRALQRAPGASSPELKVAQDQMKLLSKTAAIAEKQLKALSELVKDTKAIREQQPAELGL